MLFNIIKKTTLSVSFIIFALINIIVFTGKNNNAAQAEKLGEYRWVSQAQVACHSSTYGDYTDYVDTFECKDIGGATDCRVGVTKHCPPAPCNM